MVDNFSTKVFDWIWAKGGIFCLIWAYGIYKILSSKDSKVLGFAFNDTEKGLGLVLFSILCLLAHAAFSAWLSVKKHRDPKSYSKNVYEATIEARSVAAGSLLPPHELASLEDSLSSIRGLMHRIPKDNGNRKVLLEVLGEIKAEIKNRKTDPNHRGSRVDNIKKFLELTEWSLRGRNENDT